MRTLIFMRDVFKKHAALFISNILFLILQGLVEAVAIFSLIPVVDFLIKTDLSEVSLITRKFVMIMQAMGLPVNIAAFLAIFLLFNILISGLQVLVKYCILRIKYAVCRELIVSTFRDFFNAKWYFFSSNRQGVLLNTFINEINIVGDAFGGMATIFANFVHLILYLVVPFYLSWKIASISLVTGLLFAFPFALLGKINYRLGQLNTLTANQISSVIQESLISAKIILGFGNQAKSVKMLGDAFDKHTKATIKSQTIGFAVPSMYYPLGLVVVTISLFAARKLNTSFSETAALLYSLMKLMPYIGQLPTLKNTVDNFFPSYEQVLNLRHTAEQLTQVSGPREFKGFAKEIALKDFSFAYPAHEPILKHVNISVPKGKMVAFVGGSGVGKSTLIDAIMGFNEPATGSITFDGIPLQELNINSYRQRIGYVPQDSVLFNMSIRDNLLWAAESATDEEIIKACRQANAEEFIKSLPSGYNTIVGDRGVRLSGGQVQRVALARAILRKPELLILDEATSALDTYSEKLIQQAIDAIAKETTVILVAHRFSTIINADYIYVFKDGHVIEEGTYSGLLQNKEGRFRKMVELQSLEISGAKDSLR